MKSVLANYVVTPKIVLSGNVSNILIKPQGEHAAFGLKEYIAQFVPMSASREPFYDYTTQNVAVGEDGCLRFSYLFTGEQEYKIRLFDPADNEPDAQSPDRVLKPGKEKLDIRVYALHKDLYERRPYRGDFHTHSICSDGSEDPEITASNFRKSGFDFYALTDHRRYWPSIRCKEYYSTKPVDFKVIAGEEVHAPNNHVHIVNFGGCESINEMYEKDPERYDAEVREILAELNAAGHKIADGLEDYAYAYASCLWVFRKIKEAEGLSIFCHPHWMADAYHISDALTDTIFKGGGFDAFELLGGQEVYSNNLQTVYYYEKCAEGIKVPIVGVSDAHNTGDGAKWFNWTSTIVFAPDLELRSIIDSVKDFYSVAVETYPDEASRVHASFRLVKYAKFLLEEYFPVHDELCYEEGRLMKAMYLGDRDAEPLLAGMRGRCDRLMRQYWGENL